MAKIKDTELVKRWKAKTPKFWRKVQRIALTVGTVSGVLLAAPVALPATLLTLAGYGLTVGSVGAVLSQLTREDNGKTEERPASN
jgi:hypothetical protein